MSFNPYEDWSEEDHEVTRMTIITEEMQAEQEARLQESFAGLTAAVHKCIAERDELRTELIAFKAMRSVLGQEKADLLSERDALRAVLREIVQSEPRKGFYIPVALVERAEKLLEGAA